MTPRLILMYSSPFKGIPASTKRLCKRPVEELEAKSWDTDFSKEARVAFIVSFSPRLFASTDPITACKRSTYRLRVEKDLIKPIKAKTTAMNMKKTIKYSN
jgi:hypothetical protein